MSAKYYFVKLHPEMRKFVVDHDFAKKVLKEAVDDPEVSASFARLQCEVINLITRSCWEHLYEVSSFHERMKLQIEFDGENSYIFERFKKKKIVPSEN